MTTRKEMYTNCLLIESMIKTMVVNGETRNEKLVEAVDELLKNSVSVSTKKSKNRLGFKPIDLAINNVRTNIDNFNFENCHIEFCLGLIVEKDKIIITYSTYDYNCKIAIYEKKYIESIITWI